MSYKFYEETRFKESEVGPIPKDWQVGRLGEVSTISSGGSAPQGDFYFGGKNYFIRVSHIDNQTNTIKTFDLITDEAVKKYKLKLYQKGTIVFPKSGATVYLEKRAQLPFDAYIVSHLCAVHSNSKNLDQKFLYFVLLKSKFAEKKGDGYPTLNLSEIKQIPIPLPPLSEQKAIAEVLSIIQEAKEKTEEVIKATKELKKSIMKHLFTYGPVPLSETDKVKLKETEIGLIPEHWQVVRLGEVVETFSGGTPRREIKEYYGGDIKWLKSGELKDNFIFSTEETITPEGLKNSSAKYVEKGTLLIAMYGATAGRVGYVMERLTINQAICAIKPKFANFYSLFYFYLFQKIRENILSMRYGGAQPNLNQQIISNLLIPLPPLHEQKAIAEILQTIDDKIQKEEARKQAIENLFKSMLSKLMSGELRVHRVKSYG